MYRNIEVIWTGKKREKYYPYERYEKKNETNKPLNTRDNPTTITPYNIRYRETRPPHGIDDEIFVIITNRYFDRVARAPRKFCFDVPRPRLLNRVPPHYARVCMLAGRREHGVRVEATRL